MYRASRVIIKQLKKKKKESSSKEIMEAQLLQEKELNKKEMIWLHSYLKVKNEIKFFILYLFDKN